MAVRRIEVDEYTCELCGHKWISRLNGKDKPKPKRCAKCKDERWEHGRLSYENERLRTLYSVDIRNRFLQMDYPGLRPDYNAKKFLSSRPSIEHLMLVAQPMSRVHEIPFKQDSHEQEYYKRLRDLQRYNLQWVMEEMNGLEYDSNLEGHGSSQSTRQIRMEKRLAKLMSNANTANSS